MEGRSEKHFIKRSHIYIYIYEEEERFNEISSRIAQMSFLLLPLPLHARKISAGFDPRGELRSA